MKSILSLFLCYAFLGFAAHAEAPKTDSLKPFAPDLAIFNKAVAANWKEKVREKEPLPKIEIGSVQYLPPEVLKASQQEFTFIKILKEIGDAAETYRTEYDMDAGQFTFAFDNGRSALPVQKAAIGILHRGKIYLLDGHHKVMISLYMNAETLPVHVIDDWSDLSPQKFRERMIERRYAYPLDKNGEPMSRFYDFDELTDNPNLYLARLLIQKVKGGIELEKFKLFSVSGAKRPLILKFNEGLPFIEYFIANLLAHHDIFYDEEWGGKIPKETRKEIRTLLAKEAKKKDSP
ncbi:MAG: ParB-like protein, partial [Bdellovibrionota bacterium]